MPALSTLVTFLLALLAGGTAAHAQTPQTPLMPQETQTAPTATSSDAQLPTVSVVESRSWTIDTILVRNAGNGDKVTMAMASRMPPPGVTLRHIVIASSNSPVPGLPPNQSSAVLNFSLPWISNAARLNSHGIGVIYTDVPSDANRRSAAARAVELADDLKNAVRHVAARYPGVPIHIGVYSTAAIASLNAVRKLEGVSKMVVVSGAFLDARTIDWRHLKTPVMLVHAPSAQCDVSPFWEADLVARNNHFTLVTAGYKGEEKRASCGITARSQLAHLGDQFAALVATWFDGGELPGTIGYPVSDVAWREEVLPFRADSKKLEMTLLLPPGDGPFPVLVFNHGDIILDLGYFETKRRYRNMVVAREFLQRGIAVAFPDRPGVGLSEGIYLLPPTLYDADASYTARQHAKSIIPAIDTLRQMPLIDSSRIIIAGQSAGGFATVYLAGRNLPGVIGAIEFSGARPDNRMGERANYRNPIMIDTHAEAGKTAQVPLLMIYAENDSRSTVNTIELSRDAFAAAGGKVTLLLSPPTREDGHFIFNRPEFWRPGTLQYLRDINAIAPAAKPLQ